MSFLYRNECKPYRKGDNEFEFEKICDVILCKHYAMVEVENKLMKCKARNAKELDSTREKIIDKFKRLVGMTAERLKYVETKIDHDFISSCSLDDIIRRVYTNYEIGHWHLELIARIPHILAEYGDKKGMDILNKQVPELLKYYETHVIKDCDKYLEPSLCMKYAKIILEMNDYLGEINSIDCEKIRLQEPFESKPKGYHYKKKFWLVKTSCIHLCSIYYYQKFSKEYGCLFQLHCLFLKLSNFENHKINVLNAVKFKACKTLVLIAESGCQCDLEKLLNDLKNVKNEVILIVNENHPFECDRSNFTWNSLDTSSKKDLMNKEFHFKDKNMTLEKMFGTNLEIELLDVAALASLIENNCIAIDEEKVLESENNDYYIERYFSQQIIKNDIIKEEYGDISNEKHKSNMILFISNANKDDLLNLSASEVEIQHCENDNIILRGKKIILYRDDESEESLRQIYNKICEKVAKDQTVHWLHLQEKCLIWKCSNKDLFELNEYVNKDVTYKYKDLSEFFKIGLGENIIVLADDPGMGKSTAVSKISFFNKTNHLGYWVVRFNLFDYMSQLKNIDFDAEDTDKAIDFVTDMLDFKEPFEKCIFKLCCKHTKKVVIIFDGFDEINSCCKEKLIRLLKGLKKSEVAQVWVTTRFHEKVHLEKELEVISYTLNKWTKEDQKKFMLEFWKKKFDAVPTASSMKIGNNGETVEQFDFSAYTDTLLEQLSKSLDDEKGKFTNVPLHIFMLAEVVFYFKFKMPNEIHLHDLYQFFVDVKFNIFYKKKSLEDENHKEIRCALKNAIQRAYHIEAFKGFLKDEEYFPKVYFQQSLDDFNVLMTQIGFVTPPLDDLKFIHRTFEEYFFMEGVIENADNVNIQRVLLENILLDSNFTVVRKFLNSRFEKNMNCVQFNSELMEDSNIFKDTHIHKLASEGLDSILEIFFKTFPEKVHEIILNIDTENENILHCVCKNNSNKVLKKILDFFDKEKIKYYMKKLISLRNCRKRKPLVYAILNDNVEIVQLLFEYANTNFEKDWVFKFMLLYLDQSSCTLQLIRRSALHFAASIGSTGVLKYLWETFKSDERFLNKLATTVTKMKDTILHLAAYTGCISFVKDLLIHFKDNLSYIECFKKLLLTLNCYGYTFFHVAVLKDNVEFLDVLIECYDSKILDENFLKNFLYLSDCGYDTVLHKASYRSHSKVMDKLLCFAEYVLGKDSYRDFLFLRNVKGYTFVHKAALYSARGFFITICERIKITLGSSFVKLLKETNKYGNTILHTVAHRGELDIAKEVCESLNNGITDDFILKTDSDGDTFLHKASIKGHVEVLEHMTAFFKQKLSSISSFPLLLHMCNNHKNRFWDLAKRVVDKDRACKVEEFAVQILKDYPLE